MEDIHRMIQGFRRFRKTYFSGETELFDRLQEGQEPRTLVVACSDSRVDPALLTRSKPGDMFVIRNVANLVPPYEPDSRFHGVSSALEYAVRVLKVEHIVVLGHSDCGGIRTMLSADSAALNGEFIGHWMEIARPAFDEVVARLGHKPLELQLQALEKAAIMLSIENLLSFPWIKNATEAGQLHIHGWYFDLRKGELSCFDPDRNDFIAIS